MSERDREREKYSGRDGGRDRNASSSSGGGASSTNPHLAPISEKVSVWLKPVEDPKHMSTDSTSSSDIPQLKGPSKYIFESGFFKNTTTGQGQIAYVAPITAPSNNVPPPLSQLQYQLADPSYLDNTPTAFSSTSFGAGAGGKQSDASKRSDLMCTICGDYFEDAHSIGCCFTSFCRSCISDHLRSHAGVCASCDEPNMTDAELEANPNLQKAVEEYLLLHPYVVRGAIREAKRNGTAGANLNAAFNQVESYPLPPPPPTYAAQAPAQPVKRQADDFQEGDHPDSKRLRYTTPAQ